MKVGHLHAWLLSLSDPTGPRCLPVRPLPADRWARLCSQADYHGVLPAVGANAKRVVAAEGAARLVADGDVAAGMEKILAEIQRLLIRRAAFSLVIRGQIREMAAAAPAAGVRAAMLKGADFADHLYPDPSLRPFTDLDLLVPREDEAAVEKMLSGLGYTPQETAMKYDSGYGERSWVRRGRHEGTVEVHWNLVNSPTLRQGVALSWADLAFEADDRAAGGLFRPTAPARLLIAAVHAAASHGFDRLQPLYDVALAARRCGDEADIRCLSETIRQTGAARSLVTALSLGRRLLGSSACETLRAALGLPRRGLGTALLSPGVVLRGHWRGDSFRRQLFREVLKRR
jgi:hypothetical protein